MTRNVSTNGSRSVPSASTYNVRDWIEIRREYLRQLAELEARLAASDQVQRLAELGNVTDDRGRASK